MSPMISLIFDIFILIAFGVTIYYCMRLSKQFNEMQANRKVFETLIQSLNVASARAEAVIRSLKESVTNSGDTLQEKMGRARALSEELEIMIQAGDNIANRLQATAEKGRRVEVLDNPTAVAEALKAEQTPRTRAEKELLEALKAKQS